MPNREQITNNVPTTLSTAVTTTGQTTFTVTSGLNFPKIGNFRIMIGSEICIVTNVTQNSFVPATWTVTRAVEGTTASTYAVGTPINFVVTQSSLGNFFRDTRQSSTIASIPYSPPVKGDFFIPTDSFYTLVAFDGSAWKFLVNGRAMSPPTFSDGTWTLESPTASFSADTTRRASILYAPTPAYGVHAYYKTAPTPPYNLTIACQPHLFMTSYSSVGLGWRSTSGQYSIFTNGINNGSGPMWRWMNWNSYIAFNNDITFSLNFIPMWLHGPLVWMRVRDDGTNRSILVSSNGVNWTSLTSQTRTAFLTPTYMCVYFGDNGAATNTGNTILSLELT